MRRILYSIILFVLAVPSWAQQLSDQAVISLLSCSPGKPLYFHYGHAAIRVQDPACRHNGQVDPIDWTFNYGIFDFNQKDFYWKFVKGETDYTLGLENTTFFVASSARSDREVSYQPLILTQEEKQAIFDALYQNSMQVYTENWTYRYNFVYDNCATRPWILIKNTLAENVFDEEELASSCGVTWRKAIDHYTGKWSWGKYGINLLFGYEADQEMTIEQSLFLPENLMNYIDQKGLTEDQDIHPFTPRDGTFGTSPELLTFVLIALLCCLSYYDWARRRFTWYVDVILYTVYMVLGVIIAVMFFFSSHPFVGSNMNILFLNPLWIAPILILCKQAWREMWLRHSQWLLIVQAGCLVPYIAMGQTLHPILLLIFAHSLRLYMLNKYKKLD